MEAYEKQHPQWEVLCGAPLPGDSFRLGFTKPEGVVTDRIKEIKKAHGRKSTIRGGNVTEV